MNKTIKYPRGASLPDLPLTWRDRDGSVLDLSTAVLVAKIGQVGAVADVEVTTVTGAATAPNVLVQWADGDLDIDPQNYQLVVEGTISGRKRKATWPFIIEDVVN